MTEEVKTVTIDDVEYSLDDLSEKAKYVISQMKFLTDEIENEKRALDRLQMSYNAFSAVLKQELEDVPVEVGPESDGQL